MLSLMLRNVKEIFSSYFRIQKRNKEEIENSILKFSFVIYEYLYVHSYAFKRLELFNVMVIKAI